MFDPLRLDKTFTFKSFDIGSFVIWSTLEIQSIKNECFQRVAL